MRYPRHFKHPRHDVFAPPEIVEYVLALPPGQAVCAGWDIPGDGRVTGLMIRDVRNRMERMDMHPKLKFRCLLFRRDKVLPVVLLIRINGETDMIYEIWFDYFCPGGKELFEAIIKQENVFLYFYTAAKLKRRIPVINQNNLKRSMTRFRDRCRNVQSWSSEEYQHARHLISSVFPTPLDLWSARRDE